MSQNLILHIPHCCTLIPEKKGYVVSDEVLDNEILLLNDWYTEDLFDFDGGIPIVASFNRIFCDVERFADDEKEVMSSVGMSVTYTKCDDGKALRTISADFKNEILTNYYYPHHQKLKNAVTEQLNANDKAIIIDCHSFSNEPFKRDLNHDKPRPDFCIGVDDYHTPRGLYKLAVVGLKMMGYSVKINTPYSGSIVPMEYYQKENRVYSVMVEINRNLYLVPGTNQKNDRYDKIKKDVHKLLTFLDKNICAFIEKNTV